jgi:hypothetical protein
MEQRTQSGGPSYLLFIIMATIIALSILFILIVRPGHAFS